MKKQIFTGLLLLMAFFLAGCGKEEPVQESGDTAYIYYINKEETAVVSESYEPQATAQEDLIEEYIEQLEGAPENTEYRKALPDEVEIVQYHVDNRQLYLYFSKDYNSMERVYEVLCRAAIVKTLSQIPDIDYISFFVNGQALVDSYNTPIGVMTADLFVENAGEETNTYDMTTLTLYFANETGDKLVKELVNVQYSSNMSIEKLVMEQLIKGPIVEDIYPTIPEDTKLISVATKDGVCYVNLDESFLGQGYNVLESIPVYSIVNSLLEIKNINKVQILINGETNLIYRENISFETLFERNLDIVEVENE